MDDLKLIKKYYGEKMSHLCRDTFPTILETPGLLFKLIDSKFAHSRFLYDDITKDPNTLEDFKNYIYSLFIVKESPVEEVTKTPKELLDEAGYILYECKTEKDIQSFRHYYYRGAGIDPVPEYEEGTEPLHYRGEELCTFSGGRLDRCHVFFAVKKNVDEIKREDFKNPKREDEYGTSVISIQFSRGNNNTLSIKNRYNHTIRDKNPDATFGNNLDNIIEGLTESFEKEYNLKINAEKGKETFELQGYVLANDGKYYKYNYEVGNEYFCPNNIAIYHGTVREMDSSQLLVLDDAVLDLKEKEFEDYSYYPEHKSTFQFIRAIGKIEKTEVLNQPDESKKIIINDDIIIGINKLNQIISYENKHLTSIPNKFLPNNTTMKSISLPNVETIGDNFLSNNKDLESIELPKLESVGDLFLANNKGLQKLELPRLRKIGKSFMIRSNVVEVSLPEVSYVHDHFLALNAIVETINMPNAQWIGSEFARNASKIKHVDLPKAETIDEGFLRNAEKLETVSLPLVRDIGGHFLENNKAMQRISLPEAENIYYNFMADSNVEEVDLPKVRRIDDGFMYYNRKIKRIDLPEVRHIENMFLKHSNLEELSLPKVVEIYDDFLAGNEISIVNHTRMKKIELPEVRHIGNNFMRYNQDVEEVYLPKIQSINDFFLHDSKKIRIVEIPRIQQIGKEFLGKKAPIERVIIPEWFPLSNLNLPIQCLTTQQDGKLTIDINKNEEDTEKHI